jgi:branched-subunit amino acid aminotransferase/4-amino-4-deoxychorismate lyase
LKSEVSSDCSSDTIEAIAQCGGFSCRWPQQAEPYPRGVSVHIYLNGVFLPASEAKISVFDGGYMYGDGIYTTLRLYRGLPLDLAAHHSRLRDHSAQMQIPFAMSCENLRRIIADLVAHNKLDQTDSRLRITVSRGGDPENPLPLVALDRPETTVVMTLAPVSSKLPDWQKNGIPVICMDGSFARGNFPKLKTLNSLATITALRQAAAAGCPEALLCDAAGHLLEGAVSNIFLVVNGKLHTPLNEGAFLAGRTRERILGISIDEKIEVAKLKIHRTDLTKADEVFVVSSVREVLPVVSIDGLPVGNGRPGSVTQQIQTKYRELIAHELGTA